MTVNYERLSTKERAALLALLGARGGCPTPSSSTSLASACTVRNGAG